MRQEDFLGVVEALHLRLAGLSVAVYEEVPEEVALPYVAFDLAFVKGDGNGRLILDLAIWSRYRGRFQVGQIMEEIEGLLGGFRFALDKGEACLVFDRSEIERQVTGHVRCGHLLYEVRRAAVF